MIAQKLFVLGSAVFLSGVTGCSYISASGDWPPSEEAPVARATHYQQLASSTSPLKSHVVANTAITGPTTPRSFDTAPLPIVPNHVVEDVSRTLPLQVPPTTVVTSAPVVSSSITSAPTMVSRDLPIGSYSSSASSGSGLPPARTAMTDDESRFRAEPVVESVEKPAHKKREIEASVAKSKTAAKRELDTSVAKAESAVNMDPPNEDVSPVVSEDTEPTVVEALPVAKVVAGDAKKVEAVQKAEAIIPAKALPVTAAPAKAAEVAPATDIHDVAVVPSSGLPVAAAPTASVAGGDCGKAQDESKRAQSAVSDADRLFYFRRALRLCPTESKYHLEIGKIYAGLGRVVDAEHEFRQVLEIEPENGEAKAQLTKIEESESR